MWIRLLLLVTIAVGLNWTMSEEIKKQQKQSYTDSAQIENAYSSVQMQYAKKREIDRMIALHRRNLFQRRL